MSFNTRVIVILVVIIFVLLGVLIVAEMHVNASAPTPTAQSTTTPAANAGQLFTSTSTPAPTPVTPTQIDGPDLPTVKQNAIGTWQSTEDGNYTVKITAAGKWTDTYATSATSSVSQTGTYTLFTSANPDPAFTGIVTPGVVYVKVVEGKSTTFFDVLTADGTQLQLVYLDRGNTLSFVKVQ